MGTDEPHKKAKDCDDSCEISCDSGASHMSCLGVSNFQIRREIIKIKKTSCQNANPRIPMDYPWMSIDHPWISKDRPRVALDDLWMDSPWIPMDYPINGHP